MTGPDKKTLAVYAAHAARYGGLTRDAATQAHLEHFIAALPKGGAALDLGCGAGWAAARMQAAGLTVTALDASPEMVAETRTRYGVPARVASFESLAAANAFDGVWAHFSLLHAARTTFGTHLEAIHRALRSGGLFVLAMKLGLGESRDRLGRRYTYYNPTDLRRHLSGAGFTIRSDDISPSVGYDGTPCDRIVIFAHA
ncbi:methyltransferase family protein [Rhodovulum imhoffii]|uniref:Methyltransferase family protein n=1 Tax=Rhodovulum imhoffii TaxID=365340 RepID=A0A2T5BUP2_9RHOB|nr:class I SAM-dependent methyltransferase [Rhodovulum imhoffii]PTN03228.1 methyltransferase family protein [Rhodovulum imhoffii]